MGYFFVPEKFLPEGVGFSLFGPEHLIWLAALCGMTVLLVVYYRKLAPAGRLRLARVLAYGQLALEILRDGYIIAAGAWQWSYLPLHPCSFTMFFMVLWARKPAKLWGNLMYGFGLVGALAALIFCNWTNQPVWQFQTIYSFVFHGLLVGYIGMLLAAGELRPTGRGFLHCAAFLCVTVPATGLVNWLLPQCNFFFTNGGSPGSPLAVLVALFGRPWWLAAYAALAALVLALEFLPWAAADRRRGERRLRHYGLSWK